MSFLKKILIVSISIIALAITLKLFVFSDNKLEDKKSDEAYFDASRRFYKIFNIRIPEKLDFAGETVPLDKFYVREGLEKELLVNTYWHSNSILMLKRSQRYFPMIDSVLKANQVPVDFKYLALIESGLENIVSPAGAKGIWQFIKTTANKYGLTIDNEIDERYDLIKSTVAACKYLKVCKDRYNSWTLAAASYNMGADGINEVMDRQKANNYYDLYLNKETQRYVYRILAMKLIYQSPVHYGFYLRNIDLYHEVPTYNVTIDSAVADWPEFAIKNHSNYRILKELNPWILKYSFTNKDHKTYIVKFPKPGFENFSILRKSLITEDHLFNDTIKTDEIR
jgi:membrane-bound lytic murein transglycosylase D